MQSHCATPEVEKLEPAYGPWMKAEGLPTRGNFKPLGDSGTPPLIPVLPMLCPLVKSVSSSPGPSSSGGAAEGRPDLGRTQDESSNPKKSDSKVAIKCGSGETSLVAHLAPPAGAQRGVVISPCSNTSPRADTKTIDSRSAADTQVQVDPVGDFDETQHEADPEPSNPPVLSDPVLVLPCNLSPDFIKKQEALRVTEVTGNHHDHIKEVTRSVTGTVSNQPISAAGQQLNGDPEAAGPALTWPNQVLPLGSPITMVTQDPSLNNSGDSTQEIVRDTPRIESSPRCGKTTLHQPIIRKRKIGQGSPQITETSPSKKRSLPSSSLEESDPKRATLGMGAALSRERLTYPVLLVSSYSTTEFQTFNKLRESVRRSRPAVKMRLLKNAPIRGKLSISLILLQQQNRKGRWPGWRALTCPLPHNEASFFGTAKVSIETRHLDTSGGCFGNTSSRFFVLPRLWFLMFKDVFCS